MSRLLSGNQAIAYAALEEGVALVTGYPGTPSTEALTEIEHLARRGEPCPYVEWSVNEKVAFELGAGAAWAGQRAPPKRPNQDKKLHGQNAQSFRLIENNPPPCLSSL